jgi:hypothetical protein
VYDESRLPFNRIVAFAGPYISVASGALASWLLVHVHLLGLFHVPPRGLATGIAQGAVFLLTALLTWAGHAKWLTGHHLMLAHSTQAPAVAYRGAPASAGPPGSLERPPGPGELHAEPADLAREMALSAAAAPPVVANASDAPALESGVADANGVPEVL